MRRLTVRQKAKFRRTFESALERHLAKTFQITEDKYGEDVADAMCDLFRDPGTNDEEEKVLEMRPV